MNISNRVLVIGPAWIGDMVMAQSLLLSLKAQDPNIEITIVAPAATAPLAHRMPQVHEVIETPFRHGHLDLRKRIALGRSLINRRFQRALILPGSIKAALIPFFARIPLRSGYSGEPRWGLINDLRKRPKSKADLMVERFTQLGRLPGSSASDKFMPPQLQSSRQEAEKTLSRFGLSLTDEPVLALCPGAEFGPAKRWPSQYFATLADHYAAQGWRIWILGGPGDRDAAQELLGACTQRDRVISLAGRTKILEAVDLLALATAVVSNDSGLMHVAAAVGVPTVGIFGSSSELHTPPLGERAAAVSQAMSCRPCFARTCPLEHTNCLKTLLPETVIRELTALLEDDAKTGSYNRR